MTEYKLMQVEEGRCYFARVAVRITSRAAPGVVSQAIPDEVNEEDGEVNTATEPSWVQAATAGASEAIAAAGLVEAVSVEVVKVAGSTVDTTENAVKCAAAMATWQALFPGSTGEPSLRFDRDTRNWFVEYTV